MHLSPDEFKEMRKALRLTQPQMAQMLGYSAGSRISEIERGLWPCSETVVRLMVAYVSGYRPDDWPTRRSPR